MAGVEAGFSRRAPRASDWGRCPPGTDPSHPADLSLWLIGLGVGMHWNNPQRSQVERGRRAFPGTSARWCEPWTCRTPAELQARLERMDRLYREVYPYQKRRSRLEVFPGLEHSGRSYDSASEMAPVGRGSGRALPMLLTTTVPVRRVDPTGRVSLYNRRHYVGRLHQGKDVCVLYGPEFNEWVFADREGRQLSRRSADQLSSERVMNLNVTNRR